MTPYFSISTGLVPKEEVMSQTIGISGEKGMVLNSTPSTVSFST